jgi:DNA-directed RNA polymerase specialized sigma24 family protein
MSQNELSELLSKLDQIIRLLALSVTRGMKQGEQIIMLSNAGFQPKEIADLLGTTANTVRVTLSNHRKTLRGNELRQLEGKVKTDGQ